VVSVTDDGGALRDRGGAGRDAGGDGGAGGGPSAADPTRSTSARRCVREKGEGSRCILPYTSGNHFLFSTARMLQPGWLELAVAADSVVLAGQSGDGLIDGHGLIDLAGGDRGAARGGRGAALRAGRGGGAAGGERAIRWTGEDWPLRIGSHSSVAGETTYRVVGRRVAACGDGVVDCAEGCDDGNVQDGDGCSAVCASEVEAGTTEAESDRGGRRGESSTGAAESSSGDGAERAAGWRWRVRLCDRRGGAAGGAAARVAAATTAVTEPAGAMSPAPRMAGFGSPALGAGATHRRRLASRAQEKLHWSSVNLSIALLPLFQSALHSRYA
jgi:cysteine-rich repeat protein